MLKHLALKDFALVDALELDLGEGLCLLTGETGAGKSILVEAVGLLAGDRADTEMVRSGADEAVLEAVFDPRERSGQVADLLRSWDVPASGDVVVRRRVHRSGRGSATVNGSAVTVAQLREAGSLLVQVHGQHQSQSLLDEEAHRRILDSSGSVAPHADALRAGFDLLKASLEDLRALQRSQAERAQRLDTIQFQRAEIDRVAPKPGEDEGLHASLGRLQNAEQIVANAAALSAILREGEGAVSGRLAEAAHRLQELGDVDPAWTPYLRDLRSAGEVLSSIAQEAERTASSVAFDPEALEQALQRAADLDRLKRKYGPTLDEVLALRQTLEEDHRRLTAGPASLQEAQARADEAFQAFMLAAGGLSRARASAAGRLSADVESELKPLAMEKARFLVQLVPREVSGPAQATPAGLEDVRFLFSANPGEPPRPLAKIASGGELSRTLLALLTASRHGQGPHTLIFDEVDAGIGGRPAERVGRRLRDLASRHQVLCITHLPQIAAFAHQHVRVEKVARARRTVIAARSLAERERAAELARMLAGETVTASAEAHARELLRSARETLPLG